MKHILALYFCIAISACGTDTSSGERESETSFGGEPTPDVAVTTSTGKISDRAGFSMRLTDAPIEDLSGVVLTFTAVEMNRKKTGWTRYTLPEPQPINLLALQGLTTADLLLHMPIEPGEYKQVRFFVDGSPMANHVVHKTGGMSNLEVPKGATKGIKLKKNFTIPEDQLVNFTVDFDLRQSIKYKKKSGTYELKPKMRLVVDENVGFIRGTVDPALLLGPGCSDMDVDSHNSAYVYKGHNATTDDIDESSTTNNEPVTTTTIGYEAASGKFVYTAAFLPEDDYTIALTCVADLDDLDADDALPFFFTQNVSIMVSDTTFLRP